MIGQHLHKFDLQLCAYAVDNLAQHMDRPKFAAQVDKILNGRPLLLDYLKNAGEKSIEAEDVRLLLNNKELNSLESTAEGIFDRHWQPDEALHRRYIGTVKEIRDNLSRQAAEDWSEECARFAKCLEADRVRLPQGISIIREWVRRLRTLLGAMGAVSMLPRPDGPLPTPTMPAATLVAPDGPLDGASPAEDLEDIERMRRAINENAKGNEQKPQVLIKAAKINKQRGRIALRWLETHEGYRGHGRPRKQPPPSDHEGSPPTPP